MELESLYIHRDFQGNGVASQLWHTALAATPCFKKSFWWVRASLAGWPVYKHWGFIEQERQQNIDGFTTIDAYWISS